MTQILSTDHLIFEKCYNPNESYIRVARWNDKGEYIASEDIRLGDDEAGVKFLNIIAALFEISPVTTIREEKIK